MWARTSSSSYGRKWRQHQATKNQLDGLPFFLKYGAPLARAFDARRNSANIYGYLFFVLVIVTTLGYVIINSKTTLICFSHLFSEQSQGDRKVFSFDAMCFITLGNKAISGKCCRS